MYLAFTTVTCYDGPLVHTEIEHNSRKLVELSINNHIVDLVHKHHTRLTNGI